MRCTATANGNSLLGLNHTSSPPDTQGVSGKNRGEERCSLAAPIDLSIVPGLGTRAEMQEAHNINNGAMSLINNTAMPRNRGPAESETEEGVSPSSIEESETSQQEPAHEEMSENPFWDRIETSSDMSSVDEVEITEYESTGKHFQSKIGKKKGITLASWNIRGKNDGAHNSKWPKIARIMRMKRIAVMAVQEARMTQEDVAQIEGATPKIKIIANGQYSNRLGVAFAINTDLINTEKTEHKTVIPSRASMLKLTWGDSQTLALLNLYAPNNNKEKESFFKKVTAMVKKNEYKNLCIMGDFNCVENDIDRSPPHRDNKVVVASLNKIIMHHKLVDVWRMQNPIVREFSFIQTSTKAMACLDRIYVHKDLLNYVYDNEVGMGQEISDHDPVFVKMMADNLPYCGEGLWRLPDEMVKNRKFRQMSEKKLRAYDKWVQEYLLNEMQCENAQEIKDLRIGGQNPQSKWEALKKVKGLKRDMGTQSKRVSSKNVTEINREKTREELIFLKNSLNKIGENRLKRAKMSAQARLINEGEQCSKYWFALNKPKEPANIILGLQDEEGVVQTETRKMVGIASKYHESLQGRPPMDLTRTRAIKRIKKHIKERLNGEESKELDAETSLEEIKEGLKQSQAGKCPGHSGITYEFWKSWREPKPSKDGDEEKKPISISSILQTVFNDIERHGVENEAYTKGVMCLIYKKKNKTKIENYRPITLLETDYKIHTKTIANKLGKVCQKLIHKDQAGFVPNRSLFDHTRLAHLIVDYVEKEKHNSCIISLDQEKA